jgi:hypothetical protein
MNTPNAPQRRSFGADRKIVFTTIKDFTDKESGITVRLKRSNHYPRPQYSSEVGRLQDSNRDGTTEKRLVPFLPIRIHTHLGQVVSVTNVGGVIDKLYLEADEYVTQEAQLTENQILDNQITRDEKWANRGKPTARVTGKTERERNKRKGSSA